MTLWWQSLLVCVSLSCIQCVPTADLHRKYVASYRLARHTRCQVQKLLVKYVRLQSSTDEIYFKNSLKLIYMLFVEKKQEQLGINEYKDRSQHLKGLPSLSTDFNSWLKLNDSERLDAALSDMQAFRSMLEWKREELKTTDTNSTVPQTFHYIECDLRDLALQVNSQMNYTGGTSMRPYSPTGPRADARNSTTQWDSRVEGYIILRDLDLYLIKLARDFLLLAAKTAHTQTPTGNGTQKS